MRGIQKLLDPAGFVVAVYNYLLVPDWAIHAFAIVLPWIEVLVGLNLIFGFWVIGGSLLSTALLVCFFGALLISLSRGLDISCGCFSTDPEAQRISLLYIIRDLSMIASSICILLFEDNAISITRISSKRS